MVDRVSTVVMESTLPGQIHIESSDIKVHMELLCFRVFHSLLPRRPYDTFCVVHHPKRRCCALNSTMVPRKVRLLCACRKGYVGGAVGRTSAKRSEPSLNTHISSSSAQPARYIPLPSHRLIASPSSAPPSQYKTRHPVSSPGVTPPSTSGHPPPQP